MTMKGVFPKLNRVALLLDEVYRELYELDVHYSKRERITSDLFKAIQRIDSAHENLMKLKKNKDGEWV